MNKNNKLNENKKDSSRQLRVITNTLSALFLIVAAINLITNPIGTIAGFAIFRLVYFIADKLTK